MSDVINNIIAYKILYMLITPFVETDAYKLGIIDENGKNLIKASKFTSYEQKEAYSYLHRLVFNMKKIINRLPGGENKLKSIVTALYLVKEYYNVKDKSLTLMEDRFNRINSSNTILAEETIEVARFFEEQDVNEEGGAPANATGAAVSTDRTVVRKKDVDKYKLKNSGSLKFLRRKLNVAT